MAASCFAFVNPEKLNNPAASMDFITGVKCCAMTTSLSVVHDEIIIDILAANGSHSKEHGDTVLLTTVDNIISNEVASWIISFISVGLVPLLFVLGVPGNILCAAVFCKLGLRERINLCVFALGLVDLATITFTFFLSAEWAYRSLTGLELNIFIQYFVGPTGFLWASMFVSTIIACERCFCVVSPFKAQRYIKTSTTAVVITVATIVLAGGMCAIAGPKHKAVMVYDPVTNTSKSAVYLTSYYLDNREILDIFDIFVYSMVFPLAALVVIIITTAITAVKLSHAVAWRDQTTTSTVSNDTTKVRTSGKEVALTKMLIATSVLFVVCLTPVVTVQMAMYFVRDLNYNGRYANLTSVLWNIINFFRMLNGSINFFVYYKMGSKFRETLREILPFCFCSIQSK